MQGALRVVRREGSAEEPPGAGLALRRRHAQRGEGGAQGGQAAQGQPDRQGALRPRRLHARRQVQR